MCRSNEYVCCAMPCFFQRQQQLQPNICDKARERNEISPKFRCTYLPYIHHRTMDCLSSLYPYTKINTNTLSEPMHAGLLMCECECVFTQQSNKRLCGPYKIDFFPRRFVECVRSMHGFFLLGLQGVYMYSCVPLNCFVYRTRSVYLFSMFSIIYFNGNICYLLFSIAVAVAVLNFGQWYSSPQRLWTQNLVWNLHAWQWINLILLNYFDLILNRKPEIKMQLFSFIDFEMKVIEI